MINCKAILLVIHNVILIMFRQLMRTGGAFEGVVDDVVSPFGYKRGEGIDAGFGEHDWICSRDRARTDPIFESLNPVDGKITGAGKPLHINLISRLPLIFTILNIHVTVVYIFSHFLYSLVQRPRRN